MKHVIALILLTIFLAACAAPARAPAPTAALPTKAPAAPTSALPPPSAVSKGTEAPKPTAVPTKASEPTRAPVGPAGKPTVPTPTPQPIALQNIKKDKQPDGSVLTTASIVAPENLGVGQMELASPDVMMLNETRTIRLRLSPAQQLGSLTQDAAPGKTPDIPLFVYHFSGNVQLYPLMFAELRALTFDVDQKGPVRRIVESNKPVEWAWVVHSLVAGRQELTVELSIPMIVNGVNTEMNTHVLQDLTVAIQVAAQPTLPAPIPTPSRSIIERISDSMVENSGALLAAVIGVVGTLLGGIFALLRRKSPSH
jgi:hypothetical protein